MKNILERLNIKFELAKQRISELEDRLIEIMQSEETEKKN